MRVWRLGGRIAFARDSAPSACHIRPVRTLADRRREQAKANADERELESRTDRRRQQDVRENMLKALATRLVNAKPAALGRLQLDEEVLLAISTARAIRSAAAKNRQVNVVRQHLRALGPELDELVRRLDDPARGRELQQASVENPSRAERAWIDRLADEGDLALEQFVREHPAADRQPLRQCTRDLVRARAEGHPPSVARAEARLQALLAPLLGAPDLEPTAGILAAT
jgi:ribosome-associated protein